MKSKQSAHKPIDLYRRLILLILFGVFIIFTLAVIIIYSVGKVDTSTWIGKIQEFMLNLYPNTFIIPFTFLFGYLFFGPIQKADQEKYEEQLLGKMKNIFLQTLKEELLEKTNERLIQTIQTTMANTLQASISALEMGIIAVKPQISYEDLRRRMSQCKERICISDTMFFYALREYEQIFQLIDLHQVPLHILLLDPKSPVAKQRLMDIYSKKGRMESVSKINVAAYLRVYKKLGLKNLELKFHSTMPGLQIFIFDNEAIVGFYFHGEDSVTFPQLEVLIKNEKGEYTPLGKLIEAEFEKKWDLAIPAQL